MLLLITGSGDGTSNLLVSRLPNKVFRFNFDIFKDYNFHFSPDYWEIENPAGLQITSRSVTKVFWWKAFNFFIQDQEEFIVEEVKYIFRELYHWCRQCGLTVGNPHDFHNHLGKINILQIAKRHFPIPETLITFNLKGIQTIKAKRTVAKSLTSGLITTNKALFTTEVDLKVLDPGFPWFLQQLISSSADVTILVVGKELFAFSRSRMNLKGLDWRNEQNNADLENEWVPYGLSVAQIDAMWNFMSEIATNWGRLDFLLVDGHLVFLEYNANGQWLFLDYDNKYGLLDSVIRYLS